MAGIWAATSLLALSIAWTVGSAPGVSGSLLESVAGRYGPEARERVERWNRLLQENVSLDEQDKLAKVNRFFNEMRFVTDEEHWGEEDYWATPVEFLASGGGDCEDFSIAKYFTLKHLGVPEKRMRMTYVKALKLNQAHMVLAYFPSPEAEPLILDNLVSGILPSSSRKDLLPVYSFNGEGLWLAKERGAGRLVGKPDRLGLWEDLNKRMEQTAIGIP